PDAEVFRFRAPALPAQPRIARLGRTGPSPWPSFGSHCVLGGGFGRGAKPPSERNVQGVRLACGPRAPPRSWTLLIALLNTREAVYDAVPGPGPSQLRRLRSAAPARAVAGGGAGRRLAGPQRRGGIRAGGQPGGPGERARVRHGRSRRGRAESDDGVALRLRLARRLLADRPRAREVRR